PAGDRRVPYGMMMRKVFKRVASPVLVPLTKWYLRKERMYHRNGIKAIVLPGVFHPGLFSSTNFLLEFLAGQDLKNKSFLELGCGTGYLSVAAARAGAEVTASDLSSMAVRNTKLNATQNKVSIKVVKSDLFANISGKFDVIAINPPYYAMTARNESELAWHCGDDFEYFRRLFSQLGQSIHKDTLVVMVLTLGCNLPAIFSIAKESGFEFVLLKEKRVLFDERDFLYRIIKSSS